MREGCKPLERTSVLPCGRCEEAGGMWATWYGLGLKTVTVATELRKIIETKQGQLGGKWNNQARDGGSWDPGGRRGKVAGSSWIRDPFGREDRVWRWNDREAGKRRFVGGVYFQGKVRSSVLYFLSLLRLFDTQLRAPGSHQVDSWTYLSRVQGRGPACS